MFKFLKNNKSKSEIGVKDLDKLDELDKELLANNRKMIDELRKQQENA